ncbi:hypothetical protein ABLT80_15090, partial [Acinetobacter schindleri]
VTIVQVFKTTFRVVHVVYSSRLYPRAEPRGFTLQWINQICGFRFYSVNFFKAFIAFFAGSATLINIELF